MVSGSGLHGPDEVVSGDVVTGGGETVTGGGDVVTGGADVVTGGAAVVTGGETVSAPVVMSADVVASGVVSGRVSVPGIVVISY